MSSFLMACSSWFYFLLRMCCIFKILYKLGNFGLYYAHYGIKFWRFCILLLLIFLQWVIFLYFSSNFPGWIWAANCFLCSSSSLFSFFLFLSPLSSLFLSELFWVCFMHGWFKDPSNRVWGFPFLAISITGFDPSHQHSLFSGFIFLITHTRKTVSFPTCILVTTMHTTWFHLAPG